PTEIFGKLMSISDTLMWRYLELLSFESLETIQQWRSEVYQGRNPRDIKVQLALEIVTRFHGLIDAEKALADFEARVTRGALPDELPEKALHITGDVIQIPQLLKLAGLTASTSEALRMIEQGGVRLDGNKVNDKAIVIPLNATVILQVGKRKFA